MKENACVAVVLATLIILKISSLSLAEETIVPTSTVDLSRYYEYEIGVTVGGQSAGRAPIPAENGRGGAERRPGARPGVRFTLTILQKVRCPSRSRIGTRCRSTRSQGFEQGRQHPVWSPFRRLSSARMIGTQALDQLLRCDGRQAHGPPAAVARHDIEHPFQPDSGSQRGGWVVIASRCAAGVVDRQQGRRLDRSTGAAGAMSGQQVTGSTITRDGRAALISSHNRGQASHRVTAPQLSGSV